MMGWVMVLGKVVGKIVFTGTPVDYELAFIDYVCRSSKSACLWIWRTFFDRFVVDASGARIVGLDGCGSLRISHLFESDVGRDTVSSILEDGGEL
jgi:hypothetical protein